MAAEVAKITKFVPNPVGIKAIALTPAMQLELKGEADKVVAEAKQLARAEAYESGDYYRSIRSAAGIDKVPGSGKTALARANAFDFKAAWIEFGTVHQAAKNILQRGAEAAGYTVSASGRNFRRIAAGGVRLWSSRLRFNR